MFNCTYKTFCVLFGISSDPAAMGSIILFMGKEIVVTGGIVKATKREKAKKTDLKRWKWKIVGGTKTCLLWQYGLIDRKCIIFPQIVSEDLFPSTSGEHQAYVFIRQNPLFVIPAVLHIYLVLFKHNASLFPNLAWMTLLNFCSCVLLLIILYIVGLDLWHYFTHFD